MRVRRRPSGRPLCTRGRKRMGLIEKWTAGGAFQAARHFDSSWGLAMSGKRSDQW